MSSEMRSIVAAVASSVRGVGAGRQPRAESPWRFVTVARQAGVGGVEFSQRLAGRLTQLDPDVRPWESFDRELVEKVATEKRVPLELVETFDEVSRTWLDTLIEGLSFSGREPGEMALYHHVSQTILALARAGRVVLVGRGSAFVTARLAGGVHAYLIAPLAYRVDHLAQRLGVSVREAAQRIAEVDANRAAFYRRHWPGVAIGPEAFTATFNLAAASEERVIESLAQLALRPMAQRPVES